MINYWKSGAIATVTAALLLVPALADDPTKEGDQATKEVQTERHDQKQDQTQERSAQYRGGITQQDLALRATQAMELNVVNAQGEDLGDIEDFVLNARTGEIRYVALQSGGFLGIGSKLFAVPWAAFELKTDAEGERYLFLDVSKEQLESAPGFDSENWPSSASAEWATKKVQHADVDTGLDADVDADIDGIEN